MYLWINIYIYIYIITINSCQLAMPSPSPSGAVPRHLRADGKAQPGHGFVQVPRVQKATPGAVSTPRHATLRDATR